MGRRTADPPPPHPGLRTVSLGDTVHHCPLYHLLRPLAAAERADLDQSVRTHGVLVPVLTYDSPTLGLCVLDGHHRIDAAIRLGLNVPVNHVGSLTDAAARSIALALNLSRRHLSAEEQRIAREQRILRVATLRREGRSTRAIADEVGVSPKRVRDDLDLAADRGLFSAEEDLVVIGANGRHYSVRAGRSRSDTAPPDPPPRPTPSDLAGLVRDLLAIHAGRPDALRVVAVEPDPADPDYPITLGSLRRALGVTS